MYGAALCSCSSDRAADGAVGTGGQTAGSTSSQGVAATGGRVSVGGGGTSAAGSQATRTANSAGASTGGTGGKTGDTAAAGAGGLAGTPAGTPDVTQPNTGGVGGGSEVAKQPDCMPVTWDNPGNVGDPKVVAVPADAGAKGHMFGRSSGLTDYDYVEEEFFFTGTSPAYTSRMVVRRPKDPAKYNGIVMMEWQNVSGGIDFPPDWYYSRNYFMREGYAHVSVSAQQVGADALKTFDSERYSAINHPGDTNANVIFSQAAMAIRSQGELLFRGPCMPVHTLLASGQSQSAGRLNDYVNNEQAKAKIIEGFLIHAGGEPASNSPAVPVFTVFTMTEGNMTLSDGPNLVKWVIAGATHNDGYITTVGMMDVGADSGNTAAANCTNPMNSFPAGRAYNAAFDWLARWVRNGEKPPAGEKFKTAAGGALEFDEYGNVEGGVRLPEVDVPIASYTLENSSRDFTDFLQVFVCGASGSTVPLTADQLQKLYPTHDDYVSKYTAAADKALAAGHLLKADYDESIKEAQNAKVPK